MQLNFCVEISNFAFCTVVLTSSSRSAAAQRLFITQARRGCAFENSTYALRNIVKTRCSHTCIGFGALFSPSRT